LNKVTIHIGLHKTASSYLQQAIFSRYCNTSLIEYNPSEILHILIPIMEFECTQSDWINRAKKWFKDWSNTNSGRRLFLSSESFSQLLYVQNYSEQVQILENIFGKVEIILFLRNQQDWLLSVYKETLKSGDYQSYSDFLGFSREKNKFISQARFNQNSLLTINPNKANWLYLSEILRNSFGDENVHIFFFENFKLDMNKELEKLGQILDCNIPNIKRKKIINVGISNGSINLLMYLGNLKSFFKVNKGYLHKKYKFQKKIYGYNEGIDFYLANRNKTFNSNKIYREIIRFLNMFSVYKFLRFIDRFATEKFINKAIDKNIDAINSLIKESHKKDNIALFNKLKVKPIKKYT